jgi:hypothetical protein
MFAIGIQEVEHLDNGRIPTLTIDEVVEVKLALV